MTALSAIRGIKSKVAQYALDKLAYGRDFMRVMDYAGLDRQLTKCPFRSTFWAAEGFNTGDFLEQIRAQGVNVVAVKDDNGLYRSHHIRRNKVKTIYELPDPEPYNRSG